MDKREDRTPVGCAARDQPCRHGAAPEGDLRRLGRQSRRVVRLLRLLGLRAVFRQIVLPRRDQTAQLLNAAAIFAVGFLMRPFGGWLFGHVADRHGRRLALTVSVLMMCVGSLIIAVTPTYATHRRRGAVGAALARLVQGLSLGGEYGTSATYLCEVAHPEHRGFYSSFQYVTLIGGQLLAMLVLLVSAELLLTPDAARGVGLAHSLRHRRRARRRRLFHAPRHARDGGVPRGACARRAIEPAQGPAAAPARGGDRRRPHAGRHGRLLHVHDLHAEVPRQHGRAVEGHLHRHRGGDAVSSTCACSRWLAPSRTSSGGGRC